MRIKDPALLELLKYEYDECELTGETYNLHLHHVIFRTQGGDDLRSNIVCMVGYYHDLYHGGDAETRQQLAHHVNTKRTDVAAYISEKLAGPEALLEWFARHGLPVAA